MATEPVTDHSLLFHGWAVRFGVDDLDIDAQHSESPGGDEGNIAHTHAEDDLRSFVVEHDFWDEDPTEQRRAVIHELLHIAFRHVGAVAKHADGMTKAWLTQALEEDTEALAEALERWIDR